MRDDSQHLLIVRSFLILKDVLFLAVQNLVFDVGQIVIFHILFKDFTDVWEFFLVN